MTKSTRLRPARNGNELRSRVMVEHQVTTAAALALLDTACCALDQAHLAEAQLRKDGLTVAGSRGPRPHPAAAIARDARNRLIQSLKALHLEM